MHHLCIPFYLAIYILIYIALAGSPAFPTPLTKRTHREAVGVHGDQFQRRDGVTIVILNASAYNSPPRSFFLLEREREDTRDNISGEERYPANSQSVSELGPPITSLHLVVTLPRGLYHLSESVGILARIFGTSSEQTLTRYGSLVDSLPKLS